ncbi:MAG: hypothetical protein H0T73_12510 [Ardenticatenales bacterium]|nr:hypothetical protein [Ardenticatenales bacterium]
MNGSKYYYLLAILLLLMACNSVAQGEQLECQQIMEEEIHSLDFEAMNQANLLQWIQTTYSLPESSITIANFDSSDITKGVSWNSEDKGYFAAFHENALKQAGIRWTSHPPTGEDIVRCYGPPDLYGAYFYEVPAGRIFEIELWYPTKGLVVNQTILTQSSEIPEISGKIAVTSMTITRSGSAEEVLNDAYYSRSEEIRQDTLHTLMPWPSDWGKIEVVTDLSR